MKKQTFRTCSPKKSSIDKGFRALGFSIAEAMVTLLIVSVALAAAAPIMSKKMNNSTNGLNNINELREEIIELRRQINNINNSITTNVNNNQQQINNINNSITNNVENLQQQINNINNTVPAGTIAFFNRACTSIAGWSNVPAQWRGRYPRIMGNYSICDRTGENADGTCNTVSRNTNIAYGAFQGDAIRNITGTGPAFINYNNGTDGRAAYYISTTTINGAFTNTVLANTAVDIRGAGKLGGNLGGNRLNFNASNIVPTANENRVKTVGLYMCVKD